MHKKIIITDDIHDKIINDYQNGYSASEIAEKYLGRRDRYTFITRFLKQHKIELKTISQRCQTFTIDEKVFDNIDNEKAAYFLGLLYADGGNVGNSIMLALQQNDKNILKEFSLFLKTDKPIKYYTNKTFTYGRVTVSNKYLVNQLTNLGIVQNKSFKIRFPKFIRSNLIRHFVRGYFDGDGCLSINQFTNAVNCNITSNKKFCQDLKSVIEEYVPIHCLLTSIKHTKAYRVVVAGNIQILSFLKWIYDDAEVFLERKEKKYQHLKSNPHSNWRKRQKSNGH